MSKSLEKILTVEAEAENEWIAGIQRRFLFEGKHWTGFTKIDEQEIFDLLTKHLEFKPRNEEIERDKTFKQLIPYFLVRRDNKIFVSSRKTKGGDIRLHNKSLIGFGGHLRAEDVKGKKMEEWLEREFSEEVEVGKIDNISFIGIVNDDSDPSGVSQVHLGLVFVIDVEGEVSMKEKDKFEEGEFKTIKELKSISSKMESWSKLVIEQLI